MTFYKLSKRIKYLNLFFVVKMVLLLSLSNLPAFTGDQIIPGLQACKGLLSAIRNGQVSRFVLRLYLSYLEGFLVLQTLIIGSKDGFIAYQQFLLPSKGVWFDLDFLRNRHGNYRPWFSELNAFNTFIGHRRVGVVHYGSDPCNERTVSKRPATGFNNVNSRSTSSSSNPNSKAAP